VKGIGPPRGDALDAPWGGEGPWLSENGFLFDPVRGVSYSTNAVGALIYRLLAAGKGLQAVVDAVVERFEVDPSTARRDAEAFISQMRAAGLQ